MNIEDIYFTLNHFCNHKKYKLAKNLQPQAEKELIKICVEEGLTVIKKHNKITGAMELAFPQSVLEDYFKLFV